MKKIVLLYIFSLFICFSCNTVNKKNLSEGTIEYSATVLDQSNPMANMAPDKMTIKFKDNKSVVQMSAGMGLFSTSFISDPNTKTFSQLVKIMNKKFALTKDEVSIKKDNEGYHFSISPQKETKLIIGINCKRAIVHSETGEVPDFDIYYTNEIKINNPNFANPFYAIDGVLLEYQLKKFGLEMKFTATKIISESIDPSLFLLTNDYKIIKEAEMEELFEGLQ